MKTLFPLFILIGLAVNVFAADLLVEEFGLSPAYSSIAAAVSAANDGDRIIIKNRTGSIPWVENITVAKSLEFLSYDNNGFFIVQGNWYIQAASGRVVTIIGMYNHSGNIYTTANGTGTRTQVNIFDCDLLSGYLGFSYSGWELRAVGTKLRNGNITLNYGSVIGCDITHGGTGGCIVVSTDATTSNDVINIVGNRINQIVSSTTYYGAIHWNSSTQFFNISNNFISSSNIGIYIDNAKSAAGTIQKIYNNSIQMKASTTSTSSFRYGIYVETVLSSSIVEVMNNLVDITATNVSPTYRGIYSNTSTGQRNVYYNMVDNNATMDETIGGSWTVNTNNIINTAVSVNSTTGSSTQGVNLGNPANPFYDIDLTRNDMGCFGGSYTTDNFFPQFTGSARIWFVTYPFNIRQGNTLSIQAESFDR